MGHGRNKQCVIIGASHAGVACAQKLRRQGWEGRILLLGDEHQTPYHRPPLSKDYLKGAKDRTAILLASVASYEKANIELLTGSRVVAINRTESYVETRDENQNHYDKLVLATGARTRELPFARRDFDGVCYLRDMLDVDRIRALAKSELKVVIVGGGYIGLETAATLRASGHSVTVIEAMDRILQRVTSPPVSSFFRRLHKEEGVEIREGCQVASLVGSERVEGVKLATGETIEADLVVIGIGVIPNTELAEEAGLAVDNGVLVNSIMQTDDENILAVGDCANAYHGRYQQQLRLESVQNANDQAMAAVRTIIGGPEPYDALPWFWSDQYSVKLQIAGLSEGHDQIVIRQSAASDRCMSVFYLSKGALLSVDAMNNPRDFLHGKKLILSGDRLNIERLQNPDVALLDTIASLDAP